MFNNEKENKLLNDFKTICNELDSYDRVNTLIRRKIELTLKILNSNSFKQSVYSWGINNPKEIISIYRACKSEDGFLITYGTTILGGLYLDFCHSFLTTASDRYTQKYNITNLKTSEEVYVGLNEIIEYYTSKEHKNFKIDISVNSGDSRVVIPLINNDFIMSNDNVKYGVIQIDPLVKQVLLSVIEELFSITIVEADTSKLKVTFENIEASDKVVPFIQRNKRGFPFLNEL